MRGPEHTLLASVHAYFLFLLAAVLLTLGAVSTSLLHISALRNERELNTFELARVLRGLPLAREGVVLTRTLAPNALPAATPNAIEQAVAALVAHELAIPPDAVTIHLSNQDRAAGSSMQRELMVYGNRAVVQLHPPFVVTVRQGAQVWVWRPVAIPRFGAMGLAVLMIPVIGLLVIASLFFSSRVVSPLRRFAGAAERLQVEGAETKVPEEGPTELKAAAQAINRMQERLTSHLRERTAMVGAIAHDLRAPLARMRFHVEAAPPNVRQAVEKEVTELQQIAAATLDLMETQTVAARLQQLELALLVEGVIDDLSDAGLDVRLDWSEPVTIAGNEVLLRRLFTNIIDNAVKYGSCARVRVTCEGGKGLVDVYDRGPGLFGEDLHRAFEPFYRGERSRNRTTGGFGLGLAIARQAAARHGGEVHLENRAAGGLRVRVELPS